MTHDDTDLDDFIRGAWTALLFTAGCYSDNPNSCARYGPDDVPSPEDKLRPEDWAELRSDCIGFLSPDVEGMIRASGRTFEDAGSDFIFTRNREGTGFWDGAWGDYGDALTKDARPYGPFNLATGSEDDPDSGELWEGPDGRFEVWH